MSGRIPPRALDPRVAGAIGVVVGIAIFLLSSGMSVLDVRQPTAVADLLFHGGAGALLFASGALLINRRRHER